jgi:hypothetical protein
MGPPEVVSGGVVGVPALELLPPSATACWQVFPEADGLRTL